MSDYDHVLEQPTAEEIQSLMDLLGIGTTEFARALQVPERTITRWRTGSNLPHPIMWLGALTRLRQVGYEF